MHRTRLACAVAALVSISACSGGGSDDTEETAPSTTARATTVATTAVTETDAPDETAEPGLVIGFAGPAPGLLSRLAVGQWRGLQLAIEDINAAGGVLDDPVAAVRADAVAGQTADDQLGELVTQGANLVIGPIVSAEASPFIGVTRERSLLACSASATSPSVTADGGTPEAFFRTALRDDHAARHIADALVAGDTDGTPDRIMLIGRDDVYGNELTIDLAAELIARGVEVLVEAYPPRRVTFEPEAEAVAAAQPDRVVMISFGEAPRLLADVVDGGYPAERIVGLDGFFVPTIASQAFPRDPALADGLTVIATAGDRALLDRLAAVPATDDQLSYSAQAYDCAITLALAAAEARSTGGADVAAHVRSVTAGGRTCSSYADCAALLAQGEDIDFDGATGRIAIDEAGDITSARFVTSVLRGGELREVSTEDIDLNDIDLDAVHASAVFAARVQQLLRILGYLDADPTGVFDEATVAAIKALQRDLGLPETGEFDEATEQALRDRAGTLAAGLKASVADIQRALAEAGFYDGPIDGKVSAATLEAVRALQRALGVPETGFIDGATLRAIYERGAAGTQEPPPTEPPETEAPATEPPATEAPATEAPATEAPATQPPETEAPATEAPATPPPATEAPTTTEEATEPPTTTEEATEPPTTVEEATEPPTTVEETTEAPTTTTEPEAPQPEPNSIFAVLAADPQFSRLVELLRAAGYDNDLALPGRFTFFAPTNAAFDTLPSTDALLADPEQLSALIAFHLVEGVIPVDSLAEGPLTTVHGAAVEIGRDGATVTVGGARIVDSGITAANGVIHAIDQVLSPPA